MNKLAIETVTGIPMVTEVAQAIVFMAKLMNTSQTQHSSGADVTPSSKKKKRKVMLFE